MVRFLMGCAFAIGATFVFAVILPIFGLELSLIIRATAMQRAALPVEKIMDGPSIQSFALVEIGMVLGQSLNLLFVEKSSLVQN